MGSTGTRSAARALLEALAARGVEALFANPGTDFPSIIEAYAETGGAGMPRAVLCTHEWIAVGMAHGHAMVSGRPQAVMVHVNVGAANALGGLFNASREFVPMLFMAGRTPLTEVGELGARNLNIHWAQEMFDQAGMLREAVKWDHELRRPAQAETAAARALAIARSDPQGPVALLLPREVLAAPAGDAAAMDQPATAPTGLESDLARRIAGALAGAERPMLVTASAGKDSRVPAMLASLAGHFAIRVVEFRPRYHSLDNDHPMHGGFEVDPWLPEADVILVLECDVPWIPAIRAPRPDARIFHLGPDPLFGRYPLRSFGGEAAAAVGAAQALPALAAALAEAERRQGGHVPPRRAAMEATHAEARRRATPPEPAPDTVPTQAQASVILGRVLGGPGPDTIVVNEYPLVRPAMSFRHPGTFFGSSPVGALGWGVPAAMGAKMAAPDKLVVAAVGDGSYLFANPVACHGTAAAEGLPFLTVVFDNGGYGAVRRATSALYPRGAAMSGNRIPLADFPRSPDHAAIVAACGGRGWRVERAGDLAPVLEEAVATVRRGTQALVSVRVA